jgi:hypothetical protein
MSVNIKVTVSRRLPFSREPAALDKRLDHCRVQHLP